MVDVYDWWSRHPSALRLLYAVAFAGRERTFRRRSLATLAPATGERVLELGCGRGNSFERIRDGVGQSGSLVGLDASAGMVRAARDRVREAGWENVHVVRGDARQLPVTDGSLDAVYAAMSLSAVPDPEAAVAAAARALRPGGRFVVLDARPFQGWPWRAVNPVIVPLSKALTDWVPAVDPVTALRERFDSAEVASYHGGSIVVAEARTASLD